jgi:pilus assembly protein CpaB
MNIKRIAILGVAAIAAGAAAMMVRGMVTTRGAQQATVAVAMTEILVASQDVSAGHPLDATLVRWQAWPEKAMMASFISKTVQPDLTKAVTGTVARTPLISGEPITETSIVRANAAGFMAATVTPGMRAIGLPVTAETIAGGFILPNDRVDVVLTRDISSGGTTKIFESSTILRDVRVLAVDQTAHQGKDQESVIGKTATLEVTEPQAELVAKAQQSGVVSLTLRSIGDSSGTPTATDFTPARQIVTGKPSVSRPSVDRSPLLIYRYGVLREQAANSGSAPAAETPTEAPAPAPQPTVTEGPVALETPR